MTRAGYLTVTFSPRLTYLYCIEEYNYSHDQSTVFFIHMMYQLYFIKLRGCSGHDCMVVGSITTSAISAYHH